MTRISALAFTLLIALAGCKDRAHQTPVAQQANPQPSAHVAVDPAPKAMAEPAITERESISVAGKPACALTIVYPGKTDQPVTWNGEDCTQITTAFADAARLKLLEKWEKLSEETRDDVARTGGKVFYIEGKATASIYPLNVAGRVYDVAVTD